MYKRQGQKWCEIRKRVCKCEFPCWKLRYKTKYYNCTLNDIFTEDIDIESLLESSSENLAKETKRSYKYLYNLLDNLGIISDEYLLGDKDIVYTLLDNNITSGTILNCLKLLSKWIILLPLEKRKSVVSFDTYIKVMTLNNIAKKYSTVINKECMNTENWITIDNIRTLLRKLKEDNKKELYVSLKLFIDHCPVRSDFGNVWVFENSDQIIEGVKAYVDLEQMSVVFLERKKTKDYNVQKIEGVEQYIIDYMNSRINQKLFTTVDFSKWFRQNIKREFKNIGINTKGTVGVRMLRKIIANSIDYTENLNIYKNMGHTRETHSAFYRKN